MPAAGASHKLLFAFLLFSSSLLHQNSFVIGQWLEKAVRPVNIGRQEHEMKWDSATKDNPRVPKNFKVEVQVEDNTSKDYTWVPIDNTKSEKPHVWGEEVVEAEVLVLGAGMAGITVAARLKEEGVEGVVVVEGSNRIGGRVKDAQFGGITVELGANWVHRLIYRNSGNWMRF